MNNYFYFIKQGDYLIADPPYVRECTLTVDVHFSALATCKAALKILNLESMYAGKSNAREFFAFYLASFGGKDYVPRQERLLRDPVLRILVESAEKHAELSKALHTAE
jgi:hypothetical protein